MFRTVNRVARIVLPESLYVRGRKALVSRLINGYETRTVSHVYCGFPLQVSLEDRVAEEWYDSDWPGSRELSKLAPRPGQVVFDLGAHQAVVALILARMV